MESKKICNKIGNLRHKNMKRIEITLINSKINLQKFALQDIDFLELYLIDCL